MVNFVRCSSDDDKFSGNKTSCFSSKILTQREFDERFIFVKKSIKEISRRALKSEKCWSENIKSALDVNDEDEVERRFAELHDENECLFECRLDTVKQRKKFLLERWK